LLIIVEIIFVWKIALLCTVEARSKLTGRARKSSSDILTVLPRFIHHMLRAEIQQHNFFSNLASLAFGALIQ